MLTLIITRLTMMLENSWFWWVVLILWVVGIGAIAGWLMGKVWFRRQGKAYRWQFWLFRMNGVIGSFAGFIVGYQIGDNLPLSQTCEGLAAFGCAADSLVKIFWSSLLGTCVGAMVGVVGTAMILKRLTFYS